MYQAMQSDQTTNRNFAMQFPEKHNHQEEIADRLNVK